MAEVSYEYIRQGPFISTMKNIASSLLAGTRDIQLAQIILTFEQLMRGLTSLKFKLGIHVTLGH